MSAADRLRQAIEALPDEQRTWAPFRPALPSDGPLAAYVNLMDPTVGAALAELLRRLAAFRLMEHGTRYPSPSAAAAYDDVERASYALEQAIERRQQP